MDESFRVLSSDKGALPLGLLDELTEGTLKAGLQALENLEPGAEEIAAALTCNSSQTGAALALLRRHGLAD